MALVVTIRSDYQAWPVEPVVAETVQSTDDDWISAHWLVETPVNSKYGVNEPAVEAIVIVFDPVVPKNTESVAAVLKFASNEVVPLFSDTRRMSPGCGTGNTASEATPDVP